MAAPSEVHLWVAQLSGGEAELDQCFALLAPDERIAAGKYKFRRLADRYTFARSMLRMLLGRYLQRAPESLRFMLNPSGKPRLCSPETNLTFNLSHSADTAVYAFTRDAEIGVDLERIRTVEDLGALATRFFHPEESADLLAVPDCDRAAAFFTCWTRKEAYLKAVGHGLSQELDSFRVGLGSENPVPLFAAAGADLTRTWTLHSFEARPGYKAAVAYSGKQRRLCLQLPVSPGELLHTASRAISFEQTLPPDQ